MFVPGGLPEYTYVPRTSLRLEDRLRQANEKLCKLVTVTGATKSGKTVLAQRVFPRDDTVWLDGGAFTSENDLWIELASQLEAYAEEEITETEGTDGDVTGEITGGVSALVARGRASAGGRVGASQSRSVRRRRTSSAKTAAISALRPSALPLVIDDFHYLSREMQASVVRALKAPIFEGHPVVLLSIPHRRYDAVRVEREMTGRVEPILIPSWGEEELSEIPQRGMELLNVELHAEHVSNFSRNALGSPHLMQEFCRRMCQNVGISETLSHRRRLEDIDAATMYRQVAEGTSRVIFDRLARGPRQRSDRKQRRMANGEDADIYVVVLRAIARLRPGMETIRYEDIRTALRQVLAPDEPLPQAHEVSSVLEQMVHIQSQDDASAPVIDWEREERVLHVTDPFFAFFLKWGINGHAE